MLVTTDNVVRVPKSVFQGDRENQARRMTDEDKAKYVQAFRTIAAELNAEADKLEGKAQS